MKTAILKKKKNSTIAGSKRGCIRDEKLEQVYSIIDTKCTVKYSLGKGPPSGTSPVQSYLAFQVGLLDGKKKFLTVLLTSTKLL